MEEEEEKEEGFLSFSARVRVSESLARRGRKKKGREGEERIHGHCIERKSHGHKNGALSRKKNC